MVDFKSELLPDSAAAAQTWRRVARQKCNRKWIHWTRCPASRTMWAQLLIVNVAYACFQDGIRRGRPRADTVRELINEGETSSSRIRCNICNRVFPREKSLQAHKRTHTGETDGGSICTEYTKEAVIWTDLLRRTWTLSDRWVFCFYLNMEGKFPTPAEGCCHCLKSFKEALSKCWLHTNHRKHNALHILRVWI